MSRESITIIDRTCGDEVEAILDMGVEPVRLVDAELAWGPARLEAIRQILLGQRPGPVPEHGHWDWIRKARRYNPSQHRIISIETTNGFQGLMWLCIQGYLARLPSAAGQPIVYVDYLEIAPWNFSGFTANPRYGGLGTRLMEAAGRQSQNMGFEGRVGLHSLPQAKVFYADRCGMNNLGEDPHYQNLAYFEFTSTAALAFLGRMT